MVSFTIGLHGTSLSGFDYIRSHGFHLAQKPQKPSDKRHLWVIPAFVRIQRKMPVSENCRSRDDRTKIDQTKTGSSNDQ